MSYLDILRPQLKTDEGYRTKPYEDTVGKLTIGVGRNLDDVGLHADEIDLMLTNDMAAAEKTARVLIPSFDSLSDARKAVVINMAFNLGQAKLGAFTNTLSAINEGRYGAAADEMLKSRWAVQVGQRAERLAELMRNG